MGGKDRVNDRPAHSEAVQLIDAHDGGAAGRADIHPQLGVRHVGIALGQPDAAEHEFFHQLFGVGIGEAQAQSRFHKGFQQMKDKRAADERRKLRNLRFAQHHGGAHGAEQLQHQFFLSLVQRRVVKAERAAAFAHHGGRVGHDDHGRTGVGAVCFDPLKGHAGRQGDQQFARQVGGDFLQHGPHVFRLHGDKHHVGLPGRLDFIGAGREAAAFPQAFDGGLVGIETYHAPYSGCSELCHAFQDGTAHIAATDTSEGQHAVLLVLSVRQDANRPSSRMPPTAQGTTAIMKNFQCRVI